MKKTILSIIFMICLILAISEPTTNEATIIQFTSIAICFVTGKELDKELTKEEK